VSPSLVAVPPGVAAYRSVEAERLADATTIVNIVQRIGGALGGALLALAVAAVGFPAAFWVAVAAAVAATATAGWLTVADRRAL
jgi:sugar phosphate permease